VFASCSADSTVGIWDVRKRDGICIQVKAHECDANVISWNAGTSYLLVSGADDGSFKIWDLRSVRAGSPVASFDWHKGAITSLEW
jgi:ribosome assembly protein RRB1